MLINFFYFLTNVDVLLVSSPGGRVSARVGLAEFSGLVLRLEVSDLDELAVSSLELAGVLGLYGGKDVSLNLLLLCLALLGDGGLLGVGGRDEEVETIHGLLVLEGSKVARFNSLAEVQDAVSVLGAGSVDSGDGDGTVSKRGKGSSDGKADNACKESKIYGKWVIILVSKREEQTTLIHNVCFTICTK